MRNSLVIALNVSLFRLSSPEPLLNKDIKVQVYKQKPSLQLVEDPAQMKHNSDKITIAQMLSPNCTKPDVVCRFRDGF